MKVDLAYNEFWSKAFGVAINCLTSKESLFVNEGKYVSRDPDRFIYFYLDMLSGKRILASSDKNLAKIRASIDESKLALLDGITIRKEKCVEGAVLEYRDIDYFLKEPSLFRRVSHSALEIRVLTKAQVLDLEDFYSDCSDDDIDTLDLIFENEYALGGYVDRKLACVARYLQLKDANDLADMTAVVRNQFRGQGLATPLISALVEVIIARGLHPRYRVEEDNHASIAVARKLGFVPVHQLLVWTV